MSPTWVILPFHLGVLIPSNICLLVKNQQVFLEESRPDMLNALGDHIV